MLLEESVRCWDTCRDAAFNSMNGGPDCRDREAVWARQSVQAAQVTRRG